MFCSHYAYELSILQWTNLQENLKETNNGREKYIVVVVIEVWVWLHEVF